MDMRGSAPGRSAVWDVANTLLVERGGQPNRDIWFYNFTMRKVNTPNGHGQRVDRGL
jgi:hypothetical protein